MIKDSPITTLTDVDNLLQAIARQDWKTVEAGFNNSTQCRYLKFRTDLSDIDHPKVWIDKVEDIHRGGLLGSAVHGGIISAISDLTVGLLALHLMTEGPAGTARLSIDYIRPLVAQQVQAVASVEYETKRRVFGVVKVMNEEGTICALAHGEIQRSRYENKRPA
jgi:uncharacterized protein (TIGR00369 family)